MLNQKRDLEYRRKRVGLGAFILRVGYIILVALISLYLTQWLLADSGLMTVETLYSGGFPRALSADTVTYIMAGVVFLLVNILILIGYFIALPSGRRKADEASIYSRTPHRYR